MKFFSWFEDLTCDGKTTYQLSRSIPSGTISSPGFPRVANYRNTLNCQWLIRAPFGQRIVIYFTAFDLEDCGSCSCNNVTIFNGSSTRQPHLAKYCGRALPKPVFSSANEMLVTFQSDGSGSFGGFQLIYSALTRSSSTFI